MARQTHLPSTVAGCSSGIVCMTEPSFSATSAAPAQKAVSHSYSKAVCPFNEVPPAVFLTSSAAL